MSPFKSFNAGKYKVIYGIMEFDKQPKKLPFFRLFVKRDEVARLPEYQGC